MNLKLLIGLMLGLAIGVACGLFGIPSPAPPVLLGALLVLAMTVGYELADRFVAKRQAHGVGKRGGSAGTPNGGAR